MATKQCQSAPTTINHWPHQSNKLTMTSITDYPAMNITMWIPFHPGHPCAFAQCSSSECDFWGFSWSWAFLQNYKHAHLKLQSSWELECQRYNFPVMWKVGKNKFLFSFHLLYFLLLHLWSQASWNFCLFLIFYAIESSCCGTLIRFDCISDENEKDQFFV